MPPMPSTDSSAPTGSRRRSPVYGTSRHQPDAGQDDADDDELEEEADAPRQERRDEAAEQRTDGCRDRRRGAHQRIHPLLGGALEVAVDERLHRRQQERGTEAAQIAQKMMTGSSVWASVIARAPTA